MLFIVTESNVSVLSNNLIINELSLEHMTDIIYLTHDIYIGIQDGYLKLFYWSEDITHPKHPPVQMPTMYHLKKIFIAHSVVFKHVLYMIDRLNTIFISNVDAVNDISASQDIFTFDGTFIEFQVQDSLIYLVRYHDTYSLLEIYNNNMTLKLIEYRLHSEKIDYIVFIGCMSFYSIHNKLYKWDMLLQTSELIHAFERPITHLTSNSVNLNIVFDYSNPIEYIIDLLVINFTLADTHKVLCKMSFDTKIHSIYYIQNDVKWTTASHNVNCIFASQLHPLVQWMDTNPTSSRTKTMLNHIYPLSNMDTTYIDYKDIPQEHNILFYRYPTEQLDSSEAFYWKLEDLDKGTLYEIIKETGESYFLYMNTSTGYIHVIPDNKHLIKIIKSKKNMTLFISSYCKTGTRTSMTFEEILGKVNGKTINKMIDTYVGRYESIAAANIEQTK